MNTLRAYLWKEWRDQRSIVLGFLLAIPIPLTVLAFVLPPKMSGHAVYATLVGLGAVAIAAIALGSDLVPGEARRGRLEFLRRLPAGLGTPLAAKLIVYVATVVLFGAYAFLLAGALGGNAGVLSGEALPFPLPLALPFVLLWIFAASCWIPRGILAWPAAAVALVLLALPLFLIEEQVLGMPVTLAAIRTLAVYLAIGALAVSAFSFLRGYRFGSSAWGAAWRGALLAVLLATPVWAWSGWRAVDSRRLDLDRDPFHIYNACKGSDGRLLFLNVSRVFDGGNPPIHPLVVDLEDGSWRRAGEAGNSFNIFALTHAGDRVELYTDQARRIFDSRTGELVADVDYDEVHCWEPVRGPSVPLRDGSVAWTLSNRIHSSDGGVLVEYPCGWYLSQTGHGWTVSKPGQNYAFFDPHRGEEYAFAPLAAHNVVKIRAGAWVVRRGHRAMKLYDPDTESMRPLEGSRDGDRLLGMTPDERIVVRRDVELWVVDPDRESWRQVPGEYRGVIISRFAPDGTPVLRESVGAKQCRFGRLDPDALRVDWTPAFRVFTRMVTLLDDAVLVIAASGDRIERLPFGDGPIEIVFPKRSKS